MDLSVIVPVYNTSQKILAQCFSSILGLKNIEFETLIIDDGSLESVGKYCSEYADLHEKCRYLKKEHGGVSSARNLGLRESAGRFVMFVDSDDLLCPEVFHVSEWGGAELIIYDQMMTKGRKKYLSKSIKNRFSGGVKSDALLIEMIWDDTVLGFLHGIVYNNKFLKENKILFEEKCIQAEDREFNYKILMKRPEIKYIPKVSYVYNYKFANTLQRWKNNPDSILETAESRFKRKLGFIDENDIENSNILKDRLIVERRAAIYQTAIDLCCAGMLTKDRKEKLRSFLYELEELNSKKQTVGGKYVRILNDQWYSIRIFSVFRIIYLKIRGIY